MLVTSSSSVIQPNTVFIALTEDPVAEMMAWLLMAAITFVIFYMRYRWKNFNLIIK
jgi:hypothetical protein